MLCIILLNILSVWLVSGSAFNTSVVPPYVKQCQEGDPKLLECLKGALHHLSPYLATGIEDIELPSVEPFQMDELSLSLTTGPNGYKVSLKDIDIYGASNFTVKEIKLSEGDKPFEAIVHIPELRIGSKYRSTGILIILPASGNGTFHANFNDITAIVKGQVSVSYKEGLRYLHVDSLHLDLDVKNVRMGVKKVFRNNRILTEATNLFLRENGQEVLKAMTPQLKKKLSLLFQSIANQLLTHVPIQTFLLPELYFLKQCHKDDPQVNTCLQKSANSLVAHIKRGVPELELSEPEPIIIDEIGIALGNGPNGYRATFRNINAFGISNMTITAVRSDLDSHQFQFTLYVPHISARAKYVSTGVLILVQASGGGDYWGEYEGVRAKIYTRAKPTIIGGRTYLSLQQLKMDFSIKNIRMGVENVHNGNSVIQAALNLFINSNAQDLLKEMKPDLKKKLTSLLTKFMEHLYSKIPYDAWIN